MKTETALTAFSMTTLLLIVGMVMLTAMQLGITDGPITGNYVGIPQFGKVSRQTVPLQLAHVSPGSASCYEDGITYCRRNNAGQNFVVCADRVAIDCNRALLTQCFLPSGYELKYRSQKECHYGVIDECKTRCSMAAMQECVERSKGRCGLIGSNLNTQYEARKYTAYPLPHLVTR